MPLTNRPSDKLYYKAAIFRLRDTCVRVQDDMEDYFRTAAVEVVDGVVTVFRWFARRGVENVLLTEFSPENTAIIIERLGWDQAFLEEHKIRILPYNKQEQGNPFGGLIEKLELRNGRQLISIGDTPAFLNYSWAAGVRINVAVTYGSSSYHQLSEAPQSGMLDSILQLPSFIIEHGVSQESKQLPSQEEGSINKQRTALRLYLRLPFF